MRNKQEILAGKVRFISLCRRGKTGLRAVYKSDEETVLNTEVLIKASENFDEEGLLYACLYAPNAVDEDGHWATPQTIQKMAHEAFLAGLKLDIYHDENPITPDRAGLVESTIIQEGDTRFGDSAKLVGGWGVAIKLSDPILRAKYREEGWAGTSIGGVAVTREAEPLEVQKASVLSSFVRRLSSLFGKTDNESQRISSPHGTYHLNL